MIVTPSLKAAYRLDHIVGGITPDSSGNGNDGTNENCTLTAGMFGKAIDVNGTNARVDIPDGMRPVKDFTLSYFIYPRNYVNAHCAIGLSGLGILSFYPASATFIRFYVYNGSFKFIERPQSEFPVNNWYHIVQTYDGANIKLYVNGKYIDSAPCTGDIIYATAINTKYNSIGAYYSASFSFNSIIDDLRIFNKAATLTDVKRLQLGMHPLNI